MYGAIACPYLAPPRFRPHIEAPNPPYLMVPKRCQPPDDAPPDFDPEYSNASKLRVRVGALPVGGFVGAATLTGQNLHLLRVPQPLLDQGILTPRQGGGWNVAAGAVRDPLTIDLTAAAPSFLPDDIHLTLTLLPAGNEQVDPAVTAQLTAVELTLDVEAGPRRDGAQPPAVLSSYAKALEGATAYAEIPGEALARTRLILRRATPLGLQARLEVQVKEDGRPHLTLASTETPALAEQLDSSAIAANTAVDLFGGAPIWLKGLRPTDQATVYVTIAGAGLDLMGDYVNVVVSPAVRARWEHAWIYPEFDAGFDSRQAGDDRDQGLTTCELVIDTAGVPADAVPAVTVHRCTQAEPQVSHPALAGLRLDGGGRVVTAAGVRPALTLSGRRGSWVPPDAPYLFFRVGFGIDAVPPAQTPNDPVNRAGECLRVKYLHSLLIDPTANDIQTLQCRAEILNHIYGVDDQHEQALAAHRFLRTAYDGNPSAVGEWVHRMKNTYAHFQFTHGGYSSNNLDAPTLDPHFYCFVAFGDTRFSFVQLSQRQQADPHAGRDLPRHLMFVAACHSAWDPRLAQWLIAGRADCYVIGFRETVTRGEVQEMAGRFFHDWLVVRGGAPVQIPQAFAAVQGDFADLQPVLFARDSDFAIRPLELEEEAHGP